MTTQADTEELDQAEDFEQIEQPEQEVVHEPDQTDDNQAADEADRDEVVITLGDEPPAQEEPAERAPEWVRDLRKRNQETVKENRELKKQLEALKAPAEKPVEIGEKPTLAACEYDEEAYEGKLAKWYEDRRARDESERKKQEDGAKAQAEWQSKVDAYASEKAGLKISDADEAEATAFEFLSVTQRGILLDAAQKPALVMIAIGKNPKVAKELAAITNPIKFAVAVRDLEKEKLQVTARKTAPLPESTVRGNARVSGAIDSQLERLRTEADRTGDRTKVAAYMRDQVSKAKKRA